MKEETLQKIKKEYYGILDELYAIKNACELDVVNKDVLEKKVNDIRSEYILSIYEAMTKRGSKIDEENIPGINELNLLNAIAGRNNDSLLEDNNEIYFYYASKHISKTTTNEPLVKRGDPKEDIRIYINLETGSGIEKLIDVCDEFERNNNVIIPDKPVRTIADFAKLRAGFVLDSIENGQEQAIKNILKK